jgi:hypothetical protein
MSSEASFRRTAREVSRISEEVMFGHFLDLIHTVDVEGGFLSDLFHCLLRNLP